MRALFLIIFFFGLVSCTSTSSGNSDSEESVDQSKALISRLLEIWESSDTSKIKLIFNDDGSYVDMPNNFEFEGIEGVKNYIAHVHNWGSEIDMKTRSVHASIDFAHAEWTFTAIQSSPITGRVPVATNKPVRINGITTITVKNGKIQTAVDYMDVLGFVIQLGSIIELPSGIVIGDTAQSSSP